VTTRKDDIGAQILELLGSRYFTTVQVDRFPDGVEVTIFLPGVVPRRHVHFRGESLSDAMGAAVAAHRAGTL
jgi:hypothetical protein